MEYGDEELKRWWDHLAQHEKVELFAVMVDRSRTGESRAFAESLCDQWARGRVLSPKQLAAIRKWHRD
jgi:hypothetical protein